MMRLIRNWRARHASHFLTQCRIRRERDAVHAVARQLRKEAGLPPHPALS